MAIQVIQSRRNPRALSPRQVCRAAFGPFCDAVRRLACLTPTQRDVACLLAEATLAQGVTSLPFESLESLTGMGQGVRPFAGLGKNDLSLAINGGVVRDGRLMEGLKHFGILVVDERGPLERGIQCTILSVVAEASQWAVPAAGWRYSPEERCRWLANVAACRAAFTPQLDGLVEEADLLDARAAVAAEAAATQGNDAREVQLPNDSIACRASHSALDARDERRGRLRAASSAACSDIRNLKTAEKGRGVPTFGTRAYLDRNLDRETRQKAGQTSQIMLDSLTRQQREELKAKVNGDWRELLWAAKQIIGHNDWEDRTHGAPNGFKWSARVKHGGEHERVTRAVFNEMLAPEYRVRTTNAAASQSIWAAMGGLELDKIRIKSRNLLIANP